MLRYIGKRVKVKGGVRVAQNVHKVSTILDILLIVRGISCMVNHFLLCMQLPDLYHLTTRVKPFKEIFSNSLELILKCTARVRHWLVLR